MINIETLDNLSIQKRLALLKTMRKNHINREENLDVYEALEALENASSIYVHNSLIEELLELFEEDECTKESLQNLMRDTIVFNLNEAFEIISHSAFKILMRELHFSKKQKQFFTSKM